MVHTALSERGTEGVLWALVEIDPKSQKSDNQGVLKEKKYIFNLT